MERPTKKFEAFQDRPPIIYRPGTSDEAIIKAVIIDKSEYLFPNFEPKIIFDIGANIGVVSTLLTNVYPTAKIYSFEPEKENFELLVKNVSTYPNVTPMKVGLGNKTEDRILYASTDETNLGGFSNFIKDGAESQTVNIVRVDKICSEVGTPDIIKIDVEGAEYEILRAIPDIAKVKWITGELHGVDEYKLLDYLSPHFTFQLGRRLHDKVWHFHALSKSWAESEKYH
jgi:FkbM family methyltransferase